MAIQVVLFLLVFLLFLGLALLCRLAWPHLQPSDAKQAGDVLWSTVCSSPALHLIAPSVVSPRQAWNQPLHLCAPGARSKAGGEPPSAYPPQASLDPTSSARTSATDRPPSSLG